MKKQVNKILLISLSLVITACSVPLEIQKNISNNVSVRSPISKLEIENYKKEFAKFTTKALSQEYLDRKIRKLLTLNDNGESLAREIEFASIVHPQLLKNIMLSDHLLYTKTIGLPNTIVNNKKTSDAVFASYLQELSGSGTITTIAGSSGENIPALSAVYLNMRNTAIDSAGNVFIADGHRVKKIDATTGLISTIAGTGAAGFSGDGGPATSAQLWNPAGLTVNNAGNIFIVEATNQRIRKIDATTGIISTIAGTGTAGYSGDGGPATSAQLNNPQGLTVDSAGNFFIADYSNHRIRKIDVTTGIISTVAGNGSGGYTGDGGPATSAQLYYPLGVAVDSAGNIFTFDYSNQRIRKTDATTGIITTVAGTGTAGFSGDGGLATSAQLNNPNAVTVDSAGNIFIADYSNQRIRKIDATTGIISTVAGSGTAGFSGDGGLAISAQLNNPLGVTVDSIGNVFIIDRLNNRIRKIGLTGKISTFSGGYSGEGKQAIASQLSRANAVAVDSAGNIFIVEGLIKESKKSMLPQGSYPL